MTTLSTEPVLCRVHIRTIPEWVMLSSLTRVVCGRFHPAILGGNDSVERYSLFCAEPVEVFSFEDGQNNPFEKLRSFLEKYKLQKNPAPFADDLPLPGWIGFFAYPLAHYIEKLPHRAKNDLHIPLIHLAFYDKAIIYDHKIGRYSLAVLEHSHQPQTTEEKFHQLENWLSEASAQTVYDCNSVLPEYPGIFRFGANMTRGYYFDALKKIRRYVFDGDVYQINFSQRFVCDFTADPVDYFLWQSYHNPSPFAACLGASDWSIVSASPELFLQIEEDNILTRPVKGTRPRRTGRGAEIYNRRQFEDLLHSSKDQAELMMIVDLERNDLAKVCIPGTRHVQCLRTIEAYPTVFHAYADITGKLSHSNDPSLFCEILRSTFPGGSITGAPKIRAMEIIEELEPTARGVYTGCIGHIGIDFRTTLNIAIRTVVIHRQKAYVQTGGGIVADSDPLAEWEETLVKADALLAGLTAVQRRPEQTKKTTPPCHTAGSSIIKVAPTSGSDSTQTLPSSRSRIR